MPCAPAQSPLVRVSPSDFASDRRAFKGPTSRNPLWFGSPLLTNARLIAAAPDLLSQSSFTRVFHSKATSASAYTSTWTNRNPLSPESSIPTLHLPTSFEEVYALSQSSLIRVLGAQRTEQRARNRNSQKPRWDQSPVLPALGAMPCAPAQSPLVRVSSSNLCGILKINTFKLKDKSQSPLVRVSPSDKPRRPGARRKRRCRNPL